MEHLAWIGLSQSLFGALLVGSKSNASLPDKILSIWLLLMAVVFLSLGLDIRSNSFTTLTSSFLLFNPLLYLYSAGSTVKGFKLKWTHTFHLLPFIFFEAYSHITKIEFLPGAYFERDGEFLIRIIFGVVNIASWFGYTAVALMLIHKHRMRLKDELSSIDSMDKLSWLLFISIFYTVYWIVLLIVSLTIVSIRSSSLFPMVYNYAVLLGMAFIITYYGVRQREIARFFREADAESESINEGDENMRHVNVERAIRSFMEEERGFTNPELSLQSLSESSGFPRYLVTEVLNNRMGTNFFTYVNGLRTQEAKRLLSSPDNKYSIEAIGFECGFKSRSSFYTFFKKSVGMTPNEFKLSVLRQKGV